MILYWNVTMIVRHKLITSSKNDNNYTVLFIYYILIFIKTRQMYVWL